MTPPGPEFRNHEQVLAAHEVLAAELDALLGEGTRDDERPRVVLDPFRAKAEAFLDRVARSGVWLYDDADRVSAVGQLSGWGNELYRLGCHRHVALCLERLAPPREPGVQRTRLLVIAGASGSGRSNLLEAAPKRWRNSSSTWCAPPPARANRRYAAAVAES